MDDGIGKQEAQVGGNFYNAYVPVVEQCTYKFSSFHYFNLLK